MTKKSIENDLKQHQHELLFEEMSRIRRYRLHNETNHFCSVDNTCEITKTEKKIAYYPYLLSLHGMGTTASNQVRNSTFKHYFQLI